MLNASVHHEMLGPLKSNVLFAQKLIKGLKHGSRKKVMAQNIYISSQLLLLHANDLLDHKIIENGGFIPQL